MAAEVEVVLVTEGMTEADDIKRRCTCMVTEALAWTTRSDQNLDTVPDPRQYIPRDLICSYMQ